MNLFQYPDSSLSLAQKTLEALHPDANLFSDPNAPKFELSLKSVNWLFTDHYWGPKAGFVLGKLYNFYGPESSGKTALAMQIMGDLAKQGGRGLLVDFERSFDPEYTKKAFGLEHFDMEDLLSPKAVGKNLILNTAEFGEQGFDAVKTFTEAGAVSLSIVDSIAASGTERTQDASSSRNDVASVAGKTALHLQAIVKPAADMMASVIYINQIRDNLITMGGTMKAMGKKYTGGSAMHFYPHAALKFKKGQIIKASEEPVGIDVTIEIEKNKLGMPWKTINLVLVPGEGFSVELDILKLGVEYKSVEQKGNWFYYKGQAIGNGLNQARIKLKERPDFLNEIWENTKYLIHPAEVDQTTGEVISEQPAVEPKQEETKSKKKTSSKKK